MDSSYPFIYLPKKTEGFPLKSVGRACLSFLKNGHSTLEFHPEVVYLYWDMRLSKIQIEHLAFSIVRNLLKDEKILADNRNKLVEEINTLLTEEFLLEDRLDQEVRELLNQHMEKIRKENIEYQTMFKMIKTKLAKEKDIVL